MKKTILHITDELCVGGTEILLKNTIPLLPQYNHVVCYLHGDAKLKNEFKGTPIYCLEHGGKRDIFRSVRRLRRLLKKHQAEILHSHLLWSSLIARLAKKGDVKLVCTLHNVMSADAFQRNRFSLFAERATVNRADALIGVSSFVMEDYLKHVPYKGDTHILYNFIPAIFFDASSSKTVPQEPYKLRCIAVGNLKHQKNYTYLLSAFSKLKGLSISLDVYGDGPEKKEIQRRIDEEGLFLRLMGMNNTMENVLPAYDVFLQASHYEGYGIALVEAMAKGLVPVISNIPVHKEVAGDIAFYFELQTEDSLVVLLKEMIANPIILNDNNQVIRERAKLVGSANSYKEKLEYIYKSLFTKKPVQ